MAQNNLIINVYVRKEIKGKEIRGLQPLSADTGQEAGDTIDR